MRVLVRKTKTVKHLMVKTELYGILSQVVKNCYCGLKKYPISEKINHIG